MPKDFPSDLFSPAIWESQFVYYIISVNSSSVDQTKQFLKEAALLKKFNHKHVLSLIGIAKLKGQYTTIFQFMANGDLRSYVQNAPKEVCSLNPIHFLFSYNPHVKQTGGRDGAESHMNLATELCHLL